MHEPITDPMAQRCHNRGYFSSLPVAWRRAKPQSPIRMNTVKPIVGLSRAVLSSISPILACCTILAASNSTSGQTPNGAPKPANGGESLIELPEFTVSTSQDKGYLAGNSVSGTRINTPIKDLPFAVNAFTQQFI